MTIFSNKRLIYIDTSNQNIYVYVQILLIPRGERYAYKKIDSIDAAGTV